jgi:endonuclease/exonuclease/phosphatase family metal-dependent hydrolase
MDATRLTRRQGARRLFLRFSLVVAGAWLVGQIFRDAVWITGLCFFLPSPLIAGLLLVAAAAAWPVQRRWAVAAALVACLPTAIMAGVEHQWVRPEAPSGGRVASESTRRLVHWNVYRGNLGWKRVKAELRRTDADLLALSEVPGEFSFEKLERELGQGYQGIECSDMVVLARGRVRHLASRQFGRARACLAEVQLEQQTLKLLIADLPSSILIARGPLLEWLRGLIEEFRPDLVVGDFNAPRRSWHLAHLPSGYAHAYDTAGAGWSGTWPVPAPLWAIDQCIISDRLAAVHYELRSLALSDHRMQVLEFIAGAARPGEARTAAR